MTDSRSPTRTCIACRVRRDQGALLRFRRRRDGVVVPSVARRGASGRSAYVCASAACLADAVRRRGFERALSGRGAGLVVRVPVAGELSTTTILALDREIDLLARTGPLGGSHHGARPRRQDVLQGLRTALEQPGRND